MPVNAYPPTILIWFRELKRELQIDVALTMGPCICSNCEQAGLRMMGMALLYVFDRPDVVQLLEL